MVVFAWILFSILVGAIGRNRNIGFFFSFILSLILSPLIGLIITLFSNRKLNDYEQMMLDLEYEKIKQEEKNNGGSGNEAISNIRLKELQKLKDKGVISEEEFNRMK